MNNWLLIIVCIIFAMGMIVGGIKGFFQIGISLLASIVSVVLVMFLFPYVQSAIVQYTPLDEMIEDKVVEAFMPEIPSNILVGKDLSGTIFESLTEDQVANLQEKDLKSLGMKWDDMIALVGDLTKEQQIYAIENSKLPEFLKERILENNNQTIYEDLKVTTFPTYVGKYIAEVVIRIVSFLVTFVFVFLIVRAVSAAVNIIGELPGLNLLNRAGGVVLGTGAALLIVWLMFLVITVMYSMKIGGECFQMIQDSTFLRFLYEKNVLLTRIIKIG